MSFFSQVSRKLTSLVIPQLQPKFKGDLPTIGNVEEKLNSCELSVTTHGVAAKELSILIFGKSFQWTNVSLNHYQLLNCVSSESGGAFMKLKYLKLMGGLTLADEQRTLSEAGLSILSHHLIYNEGCRLEEFILSECNIRLPQVKALVSGADVLRKSIKNGHFQMSLRRLGIYHSPALDLEALSLLATNLIYHEFASVERLELVSVNMDDAKAEALCHIAAAWLEK